MFYDVFERQNVTLELKKKNKSSKNWDFSKRVSLWFWPNLEIFLSFYFRQNRSEKCLAYDSRK